MNPRPLSPSGLIIRALLDGKPRSSTQIVNQTELSKPAVYNNLKVLQLADYVREVRGNYVVTVDGVRAFWSAVLDGDLADRLVSASRVLGVDTYRLVELGVRLILAVVEASYVPADLVRLLNHHDPHALDVLEDVVGERLKAAAVGR